MLAGDRLPFAEGQGEGREEAEPVAKKRKVGRRKDLLVGFVGLWVLGFRVAVPEPAGRQGGSDMAVAGGRMTGEARRYHITKSPSHQRHQ